MACGCRAACKQHHPVDTCAEGEEAAEGCQPSAAANNCPSAASSPPASGAGGLLYGCRCNPPAHHGWTCVEDNPDSPLLPMSACPLPACLRTAWHGDHQPLCRTLGSIWPTQLQLPILLKHPQWAQEVNMAASGALTTVLHGLHIAARTRCSKLGRCTANRTCLDLSPFPCALQPAWSWLRRRRHPQLRACSAQHGQGTASRQSHL